MRKLVLTLMLAVIIASTFGSIAVMALNPADRTTTDVFVTSTYNWGTETIVHPNVTTTTTSSTTLHLVSAVSIQTLPPVTTTVTGNTFTSTVVTTITSTNSTVCTIFPDGSNNC